MDDASPPKWHLAHTTWFFETFILKSELSGYRSVDERYEYLFNSYYNGVGNPFPRPKRGYLSRPTVAEVMDYRESVDEQMETLLGSENPDVVSRVILGLNHEQQHQELLLTDLKYNFGNNPLYPVYRERAEENPAGSADMTFVSFDGGISAIGGPEGFGFDNEYPCHEVLLQPFALADRLVTNGEYLEFIQDGGYERAELWLSEGWATVLDDAWSHPLYWRAVEGEWFEYRLDGLSRLDPHLPVVHASAHEAFAYATWKGVRLPTEFEWERAAQDLDVEGTFVESGRYHPGHCPESGGLIRQMYGDVWQWTGSSYGPYPGYKTLPGTLGEYNGKFMSSQLVLRGASCATPRDHARLTYRNFFYPADRWQFSGIRLAKGLPE